MKGFVTFCAVAVIVIAVIVSRSHDDGKSAGSTGSSPSVIATATPDDPSTAGLPQACSTYAALYPHIQAAIAKSETNDQQWQAWANAEDGFSSAAGAALQSGTHYRDLVALAMDAHHMKDAYAVDADPSAVIGAFVADLKRLPDCNNGVPRPDA